MGHLNKGHFDAPKRCPLFRGFAVYTAHCRVVYVRVLGSNVKVVAFGKAVLGMVGALESILGGHIVSGVASVPVGSVRDFNNGRKVRYVVFTV